MAKFFREKSFAYFRPLLAGIALICAVTILLAIWTGLLAVKYDSQAILHRYDLALNDLQRTMENKRKAFHSILSPLFQDSNRLNSFIDMLMMENPADLPYGDKQQITQILHDMCSRDASSLGVLIYSRPNRTVYFYDIRYKSIVPYSASSSLLDNMDFKQEILSSEELFEICPELPGYPYGFNASLSRYVGDKLTVMGQLIFLMDSSEFSVPLESYKLFTPAQFRLVNSRGSVLFKTPSALDFPIPLYNGSQNSSSGIIYTPAVKQKINREIWYYSSIHNGRNSFTADYYLPQKAVGYGYNSFLITVVAALICLLSVLMYIFFFKKNIRKIRRIEKGMERIGLSELDYRITETNDSDEYNRIIRGFNKMCEKLEENVNRTYLYELQQQKAELYALQNSINPHFLYNTLEMIRVQVSGGKPQEAAQMLLLLSNIYRSQVSREMTCSLLEEAELCENIITLYQYRFHNFEYEIAIPAALCGYGMPKNILQPIIENFFVHGICPSGDNFLCVTGKLEAINGDKMIVLSVENTGNTPTKEFFDMLGKRLQAPALDERQKESGFALSNVNSRLKIVFGKSSGLVPMPREGGGFRTDIVFPPVPLNQLKERFSQR